MHGVQRELVIWAAVQDATSELRDTCDFSKECQPEDTDKALEGTGCTSIAALKVKRSLEKAGGDDFNFRGRPPLELPSGESDSELRSELPPRWWELRQHTLRQCTPLNANGVAQRPLLFCKICGGYIWVQNMRSLGAGCLGSAAGRGLANQRSRIRRGLFPSSDAKHKHWTLRDVRGISASQAAWLLNDCVETRPARLRLPLRTGATSD